MKLRPRASFLQATLGALVLMTVGVFSARQFWSERDALLTRGDDNQWHRRTPQEAQTATVFSLLFSGALFAAGVTILVVGRNKFLFFAPQTRCDFRYENLTLPATIEFSHLPDLHECGLLMRFKPHFIYPEMRSFRLETAQTAAPVLNYNVRVFAHRNGEKTLLVKESFAHLETGGEGGSYRPKVLEKVLSTSSRDIEYSMSLTLEYPRSQLSWKHKKSGTRENEMLKKPVTFDVSLFCALKLSQAFGEKTLIDLTSVASSHTESELPASAT